MLCYLVSVLLTGRQAGLQACKSAMTVAVGLLIAVSVILSGCAVNPATGETDFVLMSESQEIAMGRKYHEQILEHLPRVENPGLQRYVNDIGQRVALISDRPEITYTFTVLDSPDVNAFALPGGYVYISRGLLAYLNSEAELAAVLGHEVAHVTARHGVRGQALSTVTSLLAMAAAMKTGTQDGFRLAGLLNNALVAGYGRRLELEADRFGADYMARVDYPPQAMLKVLGFLKDQERFEVEQAAAENRKPRVYHGVFASHPENDDRLQTVIAAAPAVQGTYDPVAGRQRYLDMIAGLDFGYSAAEGVHKVIAGQTQFLHADLAMRFNVPLRWRLINLPDRIILVPPPEKAVSTDRERAVRKHYIVQITSQELTAEEAAADDTLEFYLRNKMPQYRIAKGAAIDNVDGLAAWGGLSETGPFFDRSQQWIAAVRHKQRIYIVQTPINYATPELIGGAEAVARSFAALTAAEQQDAQPLRVKLQPIEGVTTYAELARTSPIPDYAEQQLRLLNGDYPDQEPQQGEWVKVIE